jgi:hypothetical protein
MKTTVMILASLLGLNSVWAAPRPDVLKQIINQQISCDNFLRYDDTYLYLGQNTHVHVAALDGSKSFMLVTKDIAIDVVSDGNTAYVLTESALEQWDIAQAKLVASYPTYANTASFGPYEYPTALAKDQDTIIIAHGRLGVSLFDVKTKRIVNQFHLVPEQLPLESMATGVTAVNGRAYVTMDDYTLVNNGDPTPFRGIVVIDLATQSVLTDLGGMDPGSDAITNDGTSVIVSFMGQPIWRYTLDSLTGSKLPEPAAKIWTFPADGRPSGRASADSTSYYSCFQYYSERGGSDIYKPVALDRKQLGL